MGETVYRSRGGGTMISREQWAEEELSRIAAQPFARFEPDQKYMEELKERQDWHDPMKKQMDEDKVEGSGVEANKEAERRKNRPKCPHRPWLNRFDILPGYRWDGKVRGNNFEKKFLENKNHKEFKRKQAWMYSELNA